MLLKICKEKKERKKDSITNCINSYILNFHRLCLQFVGVKQVFHRECQAVEERQRFSITITTQQRMKKTMMTRVSLKTKVTCMASKKNSRNSFRVMPNFPRAPYLDGARQTMNHFLNILNDFLNLLLFFFKSRPSF